MNLKTTLACIAGIATFAVLTALPVLADTTTTTTSTTTTTGDMTAAGTPVMIDYSSLINPPISHFDIVRAHNYGLNTTQIGRVAAIAHWSGASGTDILNKIQNGETFSNLAQDYNVNLDKLMSQTKYTDWVRNYREAYKHTGEMRMKHPEWNDSYTTSTTTTMTNDGY